MQSLILRDLTYVEERFDAKWAKQIKALLIRAKKHKDKDPGNIKSSYYSRIYKQYVNLIEHPKATTKSLKN